VQTIVIQAPRGAVTQGNPEEIVESRHSASWLYCETTIVAVRERTKCVDLAVTTN
jgi:hypothetical protein